MKHKGYMSKEEREARSLLAKIVHWESLIAGGLVLMKHKCGKPNCKCAKGKKHLSLYLSHANGKGRKMTSIPKTLDAQIRKAVGNYKRSKMLMKTISIANLRRLLEGKNNLA